MTVASSAIAQSFGDRPIRLIIGFGAGGVTDVLQRLVAEQMSKRLKQPVIVENRPGASGLIAAQAVKNAAPDGFTLLGGSVTIFSPVYLKGGLIASKEFSPVATTALGDWYVFVAGNLGVNSLKDLVDWTKAHPDKLRAGSPAVSATMLTTMLAKRLSIDVETIPYKTSDQGILGLLRGDVQMMVGALSGSEAYLKTGEIKAIATLSPERVPNMPEVATATEQGVPIVLRFNHGIWAPLGTPQEVVMRLNAAINDSLKEPSLIEAIHNQSLLVVPMSPEEMVKSYDSEIAFFTEAAKTIGFTPQ
jgi:tripartite-type tricarboxylate transporter receptor subunit TctC